MCINYCNFFLWGQIPAISKIAGKNAVFGVY